MPQLLFFSLRAVTNNSLQPYRNNMESHSIIMTALWQDIHNLSQFFTSY